MDHNMTQGTDFTSLQANMFHKMKNKRMWDDSVGFALDT